MNYVDLFTHRFLGWKFAAKSRDQIAVHQYAIPLQLYYRVKLKELIPKIEYCGIAAG
jgi:hypothetical protein